MKKIFLSLYVLICCFAISACDGDNDSSKSPVSAPAVATVSHEVTPDIDKYLSDALSGKKSNSNERLDAIMMLAKKDVASINDGKIARAVAFIRETYPNFYADTATMEKAMYYGRLLDKAFDDKDARSRLGWHTVKAVKYVYRGNEKVSDDATRINLEKIKKDLAEIK